MDRKCNCCGINEVPLDRNETCADCDEHRRPCNPESPLWNEHSWSQGRD